MDTQLKKGVLELCILLCLLKRDMYGYELMKIIKDAFPEVYDGSIYTILRRINKEGYTDTYMMDIPSGGPARKYYTVTTSGRYYCEALLKEWRRMSGAVESLIQLPRS